MRLYEDKPFPIVGRYGLEWSKAEASGQEIDRDEVERSKLFLERCERSPRVTIRNPGSYGAKHVAEYLTGNYIPNGALIMAAIEMGIEVKPADKGSPNVLLGISMKSYLKFARLRDDKNAAGKWAIDALIRKARGQEKSSSSSDRCSESRTASGKRSLGGGRKGSMDTRTQ